MEILAKVKNQELEEYKDFIFNHGEICGLQIGLQVFAFFLEDAASVIGQTKDPELKKQLTDITKLSIDRIIDLQRLVRENCNRIKNTKKNRGVH